MARPVDETTSLKTPSWNWAVLSSSGEGGNTSMLFCTDSTPSIPFTAFSASLFRLGRVPPLSVTLLPSTLNSSQS